MESAAKVPKVTPVQVRKGEWEVYREFKNAQRDTKDLAIKVVNANAIMNQYDPLQYRNYPKATKYLIRNALKYLGYDYIFHLTKSSLPTKNSDGTVTPGKIHPWLPLKQYMMAKEKKYRERKARTKAMGLARPFQYRRWKPYHKSGYQNRYANKHAYTRRFPVLIGSKYRKYWQSPKYRR